MEGVLTLRPQADRPGGQRQKRQGGGPAHRKPRRHHHRQRRPAPPARPTPRRHDAEVRRRQSRHEAARRVDGQPRRVRRLLHRHAGQEDQADEVKIFAEPTTITGSIGVYASFPDIHKLADKYGVEMKMIKAGDIKGSGSMFYEMTPQERQPWDDMVDHAYDRFLGIVADGRPPLTKDQLKNEVTMSGEVPLIDDRGNVDQGRRRQAEDGARSPASGPTAASTRPRKRSSTAWWTRSARWTTPSPRPPSKPG